MDKQDSPNFQKTRKYLMTTLTGGIILGVAINQFSDFLPRLLSSIFNFVLQLLATLFRGYVQEIHKEIGEARSDGFTKTIYLIVLVFGGYLMFRYTRSGILDYRQINQEAEDLLKGNDWCKSELQRLLESKKDVPLDELSLEESLKQRMEFLTYEVRRKKGIAKVIKTITIELAIVFIVIELWCFFALIGNAYTRNASVFTEQSIEILAPTIPTGKVLDLRAKYRSVDSVQKFYDLNDELQTIAKEKNISLPKFTVIKR